MYFCDQCSTSFTRKHNFRIHTSKNSCMDKIGKRNLVCNMCKKDFISRKGLKKHEALKTCQKNKWVTVTNPIAARSVQPNELMLKSEFHRPILDIESKNNTDVHTITDLKDEYASLKDLFTDTLSWKHPFTCMVAGPTSCGKSVFVSKLLQHIDVMVDEPIHDIVWCYGEPQPLHTKLQAQVKIPITFQEGIPSMDAIAPENVPLPRLVIIDDLMRETNGNVVDLFSKGSHHRNLSIIFITQNLFHQGKGSRDMSLNAHYIALFKNPRDKSQINHFARQVSPENPTFIHESFVNATSKPYSYLLFDLKQSTPEAFRYRTNIFPGEINYAYIPKGAGPEYSQYIYK